MVFTNTCTCPHCGETKVCRARALPRTALMLGLSLSALGCHQKGSADYSGVSTGDRDDEDWEYGPDADGDGFTTEEGDCDDHNNLVSPEARERPGDDLDSNCDGDKEPKPDSDYDQDGVTVGEGDCNDGRADVYPGAEETPDDGLDSNCDGEDDT